MSTLLHFYGSRIKLMLAVYFQYKVAQLIGLLGIILEPVIYLAVWLAIADSQGQRVGTYTSGDLAAYFLVTMLVSHFTFTWSLLENGSRVQSGALQQMLLHPVHPLHRDFASNLAYKIITFPVILLVSALLIPTTNPTFAIGPLTIVQGVIAMILALILRFLLEWTIALAAFWTTRIDALSQIYFNAMIFLSGQAIPLGLLPLWIRPLARVLPFRWIIGFPTEVLIGRQTPEQIRQGYLIQVLLIGVFLLLIRVLWRQGVRRYSGVGA